MILTGKSQDIQVKLENGVQIVKFCRPKKKNAINAEMYITLTNILKNSAVDNEVKFTVFTGEGDFFSSGNDFSVAAVSSGSPEERFELFKNFIVSLIEYPKVLIAVVNGPAIGVACTMLPLCDVVYCSETAYFLTPFSKLGLCAEGCSSYTFPKLLGKSKASEMLYFCHKLTAKEALHYGFVSEILTSSQLKDGIWKRIQNFAKLPQNGMRVTKRIIQNGEKTFLLNLAKLETEGLNELQNSEETINAILSQFQSKL